MISSSVRGSGLCGAYGPSNEHEDGRPVALKTTRFRKQQAQAALNNNTPATILRHLSLPATGHKLSQTRVLTDYHDSVRRRSGNNLAPKVHSGNGSLNSSLRLDRFADLPAGKATNRAALSVYSPQKTTSGAVSSEGLRRLPVGLDYVLRG